MDTSEEVKSVVESCNRFSNEIYARLKGDKKDNFVYSPVCAHAVLAMVRSGAAGKTASEMDDKLKFPKNEDLVQGYQELLGSYARTREDCDLSLANAIFLTKDI